MLAKLRGLRSVLCCAFVVASTACGRIGVELTPTDNGLLPFDPNDGGYLAESGFPDPSIVDAGLDDASTSDDGGATEPDACPTLCENAHGSASCETGSCVPACALGYADCDGDPSNGCEASISDQALSCGSCVLSCTNPHGQVMCASGLCSPSCEAGFGDCDQDPSNGCETDLAAVTSCGACGVSCSNLHGSTSCVAGACAPSCDAGYADCDGDLTNGCEANIDSDPARCGSCTRACGSNGQICVDGQCQASPCAAGRGECDGDLNVTCETDLTSSLSHCGFCDNACSAANGTAQCTGSACGVRSCNTGFGNCDSNAGNGCEVALATSTAHCGACGNACSNANGTTSCVASACVPSCSSGFGDCDTNRRNGCETALNTVSNCGGCGNVCPANGGTPVCNAGVCGTVCNMSGTYALKVTLQSNWSSGANIAAGSGTHRFWLKLQGSHSGNSITETITECGRFVPDFRASAVNETFHFALPNTLFDSGSLPSTNATITLSNASPGASFTLPSTAFLMGTTLANPVTATWPSAASGLTQVDMDSDGKPGVTVQYLDGNGYIQPRAGGTLFSARADRPYVASRLVFSLNGTLASCSQSSGSASVSFIDTRIFGCKIAGSTRDCNSSEADFLDDNCVIYRPSSASYQLVKLADGANCAAVRAALP